MCRNGVLGRRCVEFAPRQSTRGRVPVQHTAWLAPQLAQSAGPAHSMVGPTISTEMPVQHTAWLAPQLAQSAGPAHSMVGPTISTECRSSTQHGWSHN
eukprot:TRINITY_DN29575_c0_g1_i2.p1 TRINITY_DN29575_c0_g1~~TRINITY_DN29575_c0_g1_i2.p1  ORF type:complete len:110 (-),score=12.28 TRINITY_DN29575_c0_g1_i2:123-416(-)